MKSTTHRAKLGQRLTALAAEFVKVADAADTLAECDAWNRDAESLRLTAVLLAADGDAYDETAVAFVEAAQGKLRAVENAIHESRASRRVARS
jgi:hypothetical protein